MKTWVGALVAMGLAGCTSPEGAPPTPSRLTIPPAAQQPVVERDVSTATERGFDIADRNCSLCHGIIKAARSSHPRAPTFAKLGATYPVEALRARLSTGAVIGHKGMPQIELAPGQIEDLIAYMATISSSKARR